MAFYTEYRPHKFSRVVGHDRIVGALQQQVTAHMFHHAYLFTGYSGVGKTTCARILASALCCSSLNGMGEPCGVCQTCTAIRDGLSWDVHELDAARFRGVSDVQDLLRGSHISPIGKHKVYILDEVHMLTDPAWNSLLKTLEEPPPFLTFILCTTAEKKIPQTVMSRCQTFRFDRIPDKDIRARMEYICKDVGFTLSDSRVLYVIKESGGNLRIAENLLEQAYTEYIAGKVAAARGEAN